jgi:hypothetical protein
LLNGHWAPGWGEGLVFLAAPVALWMAVLFFRRLAPYFEDFV